ncbi:MAG: hypothetical protein WCT01_05280 [Candidatus Shapirobacteria bacterium]
MSAITKFDVLIVYSHSLARSASARQRALTPFPSGSVNFGHNLVYGYFLEVCRRLNLKAAFTTSADIVGPGSCASYWVYKNNTWSKIDSPCYSTLIFDKFSPKSKRVTSRQLLFSQPHIKPFCSPFLFDLFFDKQKTYNLLPSFSIPSVSVLGNTQKDLQAACLLLSQMTISHPKSSDFTTQVVLKDRFGAGGRHVYKVDGYDYPKMLSIVRGNSQISFIIQPFVRFEQGFTYNSISSSVDIRFIFLGTKIVQSYIRVASPDEFRCNEHQGGELVYLSPKKLPLTLVDLAQSIAHKLNQSQSLFALDFMVSNNGNAYLIEGNTGPGLDWNQSSPRNEIEAKKLIRLIVRQLSSQTESALSC